VQARKTGNHVLNCGASTLSTALFRRNRPAAATVTAKSRFTEISDDSQILPEKSKPGHIPPVKLAF